jgi:hypothetical protein
LPQQTNNTPKIPVYKFLTFFIVSFDTLKKPPHLHVAKEKGNRQRSAKIWLETLQIAEQGDFSDNDVKKALRVFKEHQEELLNAFAELAKLPLQKRKQCTIVDDRIILFRRSDMVYHLEDFVGLEEKWRAR